ncbi:NTF2 fold immunity protein [Chryseobacterium sp. Leaf405]
MKGYYIIEGILRSGIGGTFLIIMNKKNAEIIKITHGE